MAAKKLNTYLEGFEFFLEERFYGFLDFIDARRKPLIITAFIHLVLVIVFVNVNIRFSTMESVPFAAISIQELNELLEQENTQEAELKTDLFSSRELTSRASNLGADPEIARLKQRFSSLGEVKNITKKTDEYGNERNIDLFSEEIKLRKLNTEAVANIDDSRSHKDGTIEKEVFTGNSTITYSLSGRYELDIPNPIYTCQSGGLVVISIRVNRAGRIVDSSVDRGRSKTSNQCLYDAALQYARHARFNVDENARQPQEGYISYLFQ